MAQFLKIWNHLSLRQKVMIAVALVAVGGALLGLSHWKKEADFRPLYTGLAPEDSAAVVQKLKESGTEYRLSETGGQISIPSAKLAEARLDLAAAGLPKTGRIGFEIFDKANLGATEFVEHVNYRRALEGELDRSVAQLAEVESARVNLTFTKDTVFLDSREPAKASVVIKLKPGAQLSPRNIIAIQHLLASAVEHLDPNDVSVLDTQGNLLSKSKNSAEEDANDAALDYRQKLERNLTGKINATLDRLVGRDHYRADVSVDCDMTSGEQSEEMLDPGKSVMLTSQKTEEVTTGSGSSGVPGTASNLPRPVSRPGGSGASTTKRTENATYESSRTIRKMKLPQGTIRRLSVAVLLDQTLTWKGAGSAAQKILTPPSQQTIDSVRQVVSASVGFSQERGDQITVETLPFEATLNQPPPPEPPGAHPAAPQGPVKWLGLTKQPLFLPIAAGAGVLVLLAVGAVVFLLLRRKKKRKATAEIRKDLPAGAGAESAPQLPAADTAQDVAAQMEARLLEQAAEQEKADLATLASITIPKVNNRKAEVLVKQLRENAKKDATASAHVLQTWLHERG